MFSRLQVWLLVACFVLVGGLLLALAFWPTLVRGLSSMAGRQAPAQRAGQGLLPPPQTRLPERYFDLIIKHVSGPGTVRPQDQRTESLELKYAHEKSVDGMVITFYSMAARTFENGRLQQGFEITRDRRVEEFETGTNAYWGERLSPRQRERMKASFGTNYCKILLDGNQNETGRQIFSPFDASLINETLLDSARLAHGPFCPGLKTWTAKKRLPISQDIVLDCLVQYRKLDSKGEQIEVSGSAANDAVVSNTPGVTLKKISCNWSGTESFDEASWEYSSANLKLDYSFQVFEQDTLSGAMQGQFAISLRQLTTR